MSTSATAKPSLNAALIAELQHEATTTRTILERIPEDKFEWQPHEKSMTFGRLAVHVAEMFAWTQTTLETPELDFEATPFEPFEPKTNAELLDYFDKCVKESITSLENAKNETFMEDWSMRNGEEIYFTMPRIQVLRTFCMNHIYHHRGQLTVYLRLNDIPVPPIYGPSADEGKM